jgi:hypothetical protein
VLPSRIDPELCREEREKERMISIQFKDKQIQKG